MLHILVIVTVVPGRRNATSSDVLRVIVWVAAVKRVAFQLFSTSATLVRR